MAKAPKCNLPTEVVFHSGCFLQLIEVTISHFLQGYNMEVAGWRLHHPGQIKTLQARCRNCLILPSCFSKHSQAKGYGLGSNLAGSTLASAACLLFHAPFFRFITSLGKCGGVEREEQRCRFPLPSRWPGSLLHKLHVWMTPLQGVRGWHMSRPHQPPGSAPGTNGCGESEGGKACFKGA